MKERCHLDRSTDKESEHRTKSKLISATSMIPSNKCLHLKRKSLGSNRSKCNENNHNRPSISKSTKRSNLLFQCKSKVQLVGQWLTSLLLGKIFSRHYHRVSLLKNWHLKRRSPNPRRRIKVCSYNSCRAFTFKRLNSRSRAQKLKM